MLRFGGFPARVFVLGTKKNIHANLPGESASERVDNMIRLGIQLAKTDDIGDVEKVVFVSEAWMSAARTPFIMPSQDPNRTEALVVSGLDARTNEQALIMFACVRDKKNAVVELKPVPLPTEVKPEGPMLRAFLSGYQMFKR